MLNSAFWENTRVLITGNTGFKGTWLSLWLKKLGANIHGYALRPVTTPNLHDACKIHNQIQTTYADIRDFDQLNQVINKFKPEIVFHLAAQPLVLDSYAKPRYTFEVNVQGTLNLLESLRSNDSLKLINVITTDKVYRNNNLNTAFIEQDPLGGDDPYSASKAASELISHSYHQSYYQHKNIPVATFRAGNVIGGGDWSENRLIPDIIRAWVDKKTLQIRNPLHTRPWQHVLEPVYGYLKTSESLVKNPSLSGAYNIGPKHNESKSVGDIVQLAKRILVIPDETVITAENLTQPKESTYLSLDPSKIKEVMNVEGVLDVEKALHMTLDWYNKYYDGKNATELVLQNISFYENLV